MEPATRRPAPGPLSGARFAPLHGQAKGSSAQSPVVKPTANTGEKAASSGRQISYAEVGAAYDAVVAGQPLKGRLLEWIPRHRSPLKQEALRSVTLGWTRSSPAELPP
jgi:hypothetical protein